MAAKKEVGKVILLNYGTSKTANTYAKSLWQNDVRHQIWLLVCPAATIHLLAHAHFFPVAIHDRSLFIHSPTKNFKVHVLEAHTASHASAVWRVDALCTSKLFNWCCKSTLSPCMTRSLCSMLFTSTASLAGWKRGRFAHWTTANGNFKSKSELSLKLHYP